MDNIHSIRLRDFWKAVRSVSGGESELVIGQWDRQSGGKARSKLGESKDKLESLSGSHLI